MTGSGGLIVTGGGLTLTGTNINYDGNTTVSAGTLVMFNARTQYSGAPVFTGQTGLNIGAGTISIASGAVYNVYVDTSVSVPNNGSTPMNMVLGTTGGVSLVGSGTFLLTGGGTLGGNPNNNNTHAIFGALPGA